MSKEDEQAKAKAEAGKDDTASKEAPPPGTAPAIVEPPKEPAEPPESDKEGEGKKEPSDNLEQRLSTVQGMLKQSRERVKQLEGEKNDFEGLITAVEGIRQDVNLVTDVLGQMASDNEELQEKVTKARQDRETLQKKQAEARDAITQIQSIAQIAELTPDSEELKPAKDAFDKGDFRQAINLTTIAVQKQISAVRLSKPAEGGESEATSKESEKKKLPVHTGAAAPSQDWREKPSKQKIADGLGKVKEEQGW